MIKNFKDKRNTNGFKQNPQNAIHKGQPPKFVSQLKEQGYKLSEINDCYCVMLSMSLDELELIQKDGELNGKKATALEQILASVLRKAKATGNIDPIEKIITRSFGTPKQTIDHKIEETITGIEMIIPNEDKHKAND